MDETRAELTITHHPEGRGGRYVAVLAGAAPQGHLEWEPGAAQRGQPVRIATHTVVPRAIGGRGVAQALVARLVADAKAQGFLIRPQCSYVARRLAERPDWAALIA